MIYIGILIGAIIYWLNVWFATKLVHAGLHWVTFKPGFFWIGWLIKASLFVAFPGICLTEMIEHSRLANRISSYLFNRRYKKQQAKWRAETAAWHEQLRQVDHLFPPLTKVDPAHAVTISDTQTVWSDGTTTDHSDSK